MKRKIFSSNKKKITMITYIKIALIILVLAAIAFKTTATPGVISIELLIEAN